MSRLADHAFSLLPEYIRDADDGALAQFIQASVEQADVAVGVLDRGDPQTSPSGTSQLADPLHADRSWLGWLGLLSGFRIGTALPESLREAIADPDTRRRGTEAAILGRVLPTLTGTKAAFIATHVGGDPWEMTLITRDTQTPDPAATFAAALLDKPAGVHLTHTVADGVSYAEMAETYETYGDIPGTYGELPEE